MDQQKIGKFIRYLRMEQNLTQKQLAEKLNVSSTTISKWESGTYVPEYSNMEMVANFFQISILELMNGEREQQTNAIATDVSKEKRKIFTPRNIILISILLSILIIFSFIFWYIRYAPPRFSVVASYYDEPEEQYKDYPFSQIYRIIVEYKGTISSNLYVEGKNIVEKFTKECEDADAVFIEYYKNYNENAKYDHFSIFILPLIDLEDTLN